MVLFTIGVNWKNGTEGGIMKIIHKVLDSRQFSPSG
jgi:hypothetical protein